MKPNYTIEQLNIQSFRRYNKPYNELTFIQTQLLSTI